MTHTELMALLHEIDRFLAAFAATDDRVLRAAIELRGKIRAALLEGEGEQ